MFLLIFSKLVQSCHKLNIQEWLPNFWVQCCSTRWILVLLVLHILRILVQLMRKFLLILKILLGLVELPPPYWRLICVQYYFVVLNFIRQAVVKCTQIWQHICVCVCVCTHNSNMLLRSVSYNACSASYQPQRNIYNKTKLLILFWLWFFTAGWFLWNVIVFKPKNVCL